MKWKLFFFVRFSSWMKITLLPISPYPIRSRRFFLVFFFVVVIVAVARTSFLISVAYFWLNGVWRFLNPFLRAWSYSQCSSLLYLAVKERENELFMEMLVEACVQPQFFLIFHKFSRRCRCSAVDAYATSKGQRFFPFARYDPPFFYVYNRIKCSLCFIRYFYDARTLSIYQ